MVIAVVANVTHTRGCFYRHTTINLTSTMKIQTPVSGECDNVGLHCVSKVLSSVRQMYAGIVTLYASYWLTTRDDELH